MRSCVQLYLILVVLHYGPRSGSATSLNTVQGTREKICHIAADATTTVTATLERHVNVSGCVSTNTTVAIPTTEVHVIVLQWGSNAARTAGDRVPPTSVTLDVRPYEENGTFQRLLLFVLSSDVPVKWSVRTQRIAKSSRIRFSVGRGSRVVRMSGSVSRLRVRRVSLPPALPALLSWTHRHCQAVTSVTRLTQRAHTVYKRVGFNESTPTVCTLATPLVTAASSATYLQKQTTQGCVTTSEADGDRVIHILELGSVAGGAAAGGGALPTVEVVLRSGGRRAPAPRAVLLVLRCATPVLWRITVPRLRRNLDVFTEDKVVVGENGLQLVRVAFERLRSYSGAALVSWVQMNYGSGVHYTKAEQATSFTVTLGLEVLASQQHADVEAALQQAQTVLCQQRSIAVTLSKAALLAVGVSSGEQLHLGTSECTARDNGTHYVFAVSLNADCGTRKRPLSNGAVYSNSVVFVRSDRGTAGADRRRRHQGSPPAGPRISANFSCGYLTGRVDTASEELDIQSQINIYKDETFSANYTQYPHHINENDLMYVETRIADPTLGVMIENCSVAASVANVSPHYLIVTGCALEKRIVWYGPAYGGVGGMRGGRVPGAGRGDRSQQQRFSFKYYNYWQGHFYTYLQCQLVICSHVPSTTRRLCMTQHRYCMTRNTKSWNTATPAVAVVRTQTVIGGPLMLNVPQKHAETAAKRERGNADVCFAARFRRWRQQAAWWRRVEQDGGVGGWGGRRGERGGVRRGGGGGPRLAGGGGDRVRRVLHRGPAHRGSLVHPQQHRSTGPSTRPPLALPRDERRLHPQLHRPHHHPPRTPLVAVRRGRRGAARGGTARVNRSGAPEATRGGTLGKSLRTGKSLGTAHREVARDDVPGSH